MPDKRPILYSFRRCPYAIRARMALYYSGISLEIREIELSSKPDAFIKVSPKATVPVLQLNNGDILEESMDIMQWALSQYDPDDWSLNNDKNLRSSAENLININDELFKPHLDRYKYADRYPENKVEHYQQNCEKYLKKHNQILSQHAFLSGDKITIADIAIFPFIRQCAHVDLMWFNQLPYPYLQNWLRSFLDSDIFISVMNKYPIWADGDLL